MTNRLFNVQIELHKNFKKVVFLLSIFLFVACGAGGGSQGRIINKIQANAEGGDPHAQYLMGTYYFNGIKDSFGKQVYPQNKERAKEFFDKAMSSGDKTAQKNVSQFLATEELSTQLNISNSMAQNFVVVYGVTTLKEYESAVSEIKSLGYPVKNVTSITPTEVIFYLDFKKNAIQKNISLPKAVQDLKNQQDAKIAQQLAKEAEAKQVEQARRQEIKARAEQDRQQEIKARAEQARQPKTKGSAENYTMAEWLRSADAEIKKNPNYAQAVNMNFNINTWGMCSNVGLAVTVSDVKGQKFKKETLFMAAWLIQLGGLYQNQLVMKGTPDAVFEASLQAWRHVAISQSEFNKAAYQCSEIFSKILTDAK
jgi:hypothetical protein